MEKTDSLSPLPLVAARPWRPNWNLENLLAVLIIGLAIVSRFYDLGARVMSHDEVNHVVPSYDFSQGRGYRYDPVTHGPLQFHLIALSYSLFGDNDLTARIPVALFSIGTVAFTLFAYRRYLGRWGTLAAGTMMLISPYLLYYGRYARNESFIVFWAVATLYAILRYLERGERWALLFFVFINALHFTDKSTSYIFAAEQMLFLGGLVIVRLLRSNWPAPADRQRFLLSLGAAILFGGAMAGVYLVEKPLVVWHILPVALLALAGGVAALVIAARGLGWETIRRERSFDLLVLLTTLVLPLLAALPIKMAGLNPTDYSAAGLLRSGAVIALLAAVAIAIGLWWNRQLWLVCVALFYAPFVLLYSTFFTNAVGIAGGFTGALGYWMEQQAVSRGSQPWYYYIFVQIPIYEFLPALGTMLAIILGLTRRLWTARPFQPFVPGPFKDSVEPEQPVPTLALLVFWSISSVVAFSVAGEKMPWLTTHLTLPMILTAGWAVGYLIDTAHWSEMRGLRGWLIVPLLLVFVPALGSIFYTLATLGSLPADGLNRAQTAVMINVSILAAILSGLGLFALLRTWEPAQIYRGAGLAAFAGLALLTARAAFRAAYINYDYPLEYMVYAHGAPAPKRIFNDLQTLAKNSPDGQGLVIAYDNFVRYPYWWYLRAYTNKIDFDVNPTNDIRRAAVILVGEENQAKVVPIVRKDYVEFTYMRMWWPNQDYWRLKWDEIAAERQTQLASNATNTLPPMGVGEYLSRVWQHLSPFFTNPSVRSAVFKIWLDRDYRAYAALQNSTNFTLDNWSPADRMHVYVRKDIAAQVWTLGARPVSPAPSTASSDAYDQAFAQRNPDQTIGAAGAAPGQFQTPRGVAFASDGSVYVADAGNHRIEHLQATGAVLQVWGTFADSAKGAAPGGTFNEPWGVAVGPDGTVYVADTWNHRIQKFTADGQFVKMWNAWQQGDQTETFWGPRGVAVDAAGHVYVTDTGNKRVVVFDANGTYLTQFGGAGSDPGQLEEPVGIAIDPPGRAVVADTWNQRVQVFAPDATGLSFAPAASWEVAAWYSQSIENKPFIAVAQSGDVVLTDPEGCRVLEFSPTGQIAHIWGQCSPGADGFGQPSGIAADKAGGVWISDATNQRLLHFPKP